MCVYIAIIATTRQAMLWHMDSAPVLKYNGCWLESWLAVQLEKGSVNWRGRLDMLMYGVV